MNETLIGFAWPTLMLFVQVGVAVLRMECVGRGRLFSRPLYRFRFFRPRISPYSGYVFGTWTRLMQIFVLVVLNFAAIFVHGTFPWNNVALAVTVIALYLDDYFTGDDERWKRIKARARNAIRWAMPSPVSEIE